jgi:hypothetical protein
MAVNKTTLIVITITVMNMGLLICIAARSKCMTMEVSKTVIHSRAALFLKARKLTGEVMS